MKTSVILAALVLAMCFKTHAAVDFDTMTANTWVQLTTYYQYPGWGGETHLAFDTSGYMYMVGSCAYGGSAGGTHNNDIFRYDNRTGFVEKMLTCGNNPWPGGCQAGQVFDSKRNCIWFGPGANAVCRTGVLYFPGQAYYGGLYRMNCPTTPIRPTPPPVTVEKIRDGAIGGNYYVYDPGNDLIIGVADNSYSGCRLSIYNIQSNTVTSSVAPFTNATSGWRVPCCFDTKRGLLVIARFGDMDAVWFYNPSTGQWSSKTPPSAPPMQSVPLVYEPVADKYVLIGTYPDGNSDEHPEIWYYDYDDNIWTEVPRGSRSYNVNDRAGSTWPPLRVYPGSFGYCEKNGVIVNWGGLNTSMSGSDGSTKQPIWAFKLAGGRTRAQKAAARKAEPVLQVSPNPFKSRTVITISKKFRVTSYELQIFDITGKQLETRNSKLEMPNTVSWAPAGIPAGVYLLRARVGGKVVTKRLFLVR